MSARDDSPTSTALTGTTLTNPPPSPPALSVFSAEGPPAPANSINFTAGNAYIDPAVIAERLGGAAVETRSAASAATAPADVPAREQEHEHHPEATTWAAEAEEDVSNALKRLATAADDEHKNDPSKPVEHYYSLALAKIIKDGAIRFDPRYLENDRETENGTGEASGSGTSNETARAQGNGGESAESEETAQQGAEEQR